MKSTQNHQFSQTKRADIPRSSFDLSHGLKTTLNSGDLVPILSLEVLPGDTISLNAQIFGRLATPIKPILDNIFMETFYFFVPWRQVWDNWVKFMGEQIDPGDSTDFVIPQITVDPNNGNNDTMRMADYFGIPVGLTTTVSALPFRAFWHVYNNWFRDQNLVDSVLLGMERGDGPDTFGVQSILPKRRKRFDYLTSCLPFLQKGPDVTVDLGGDAPIHVANTGTTDTIGVINDLLGAADQFLPVGGVATVMNTPTVITPDALLYANLSAATGFTINDLRESFQIQTLLETDARGGTRYPEILKAHFGVIDPMMLVHQRPQFLAGGHTQVNINPVQQTNGTGVVGVGTPQGNLAAFGTVSGGGGGFSQSFTEHGIIIGIVNVRADLTYQQNIERYWDRTTRFDFYFPALSHLGEQAVTQREIFASGVPAEDDLVFGYQERYGEYRYKPSQITGLFRSNVDGAGFTTLDVWHLAQDFSVAPTLNQSFIEEDPPIDRVVADSDEPEFLLDVYFKIRAARPLPLYGTPGLTNIF